MGITTSHDYSHLYCFDSLLTLPSITTNKQTNIMDFVNKLAGGGSNQGQSVNEQVVQGQGSEQKSSGSGGFLGGIGDKLNSAAGGGKESEKNEDYLDKGVDFVQEKFMGQ